MTPKVEISHRTIIFTAIFIFMIWFVFQIWDILLLVFISLIFMSALSPAVDRLEKWHLPRAIAILVVYIIVWVLIGSVIASIIPSLVDQTGKMIRLLPEALGRIEFFTSHEQDIIQQTLTGIGSLPQNILKITIGLFGNLISIFTTLVISFYLLLERQNLNHFLAGFIKEDTTAKAVRTVVEIEKRLGNWVRGELILMLVVGVLTYLGLIVLGVDIPVPLAILAGLLEIVPNLGPTISAVPAVLIAFMIHPFMGLSTLALYVLVQFFENHFLVPQVMRKAVGVNPLASILGLMIGFRLAGPLGAVLAIPIILVVQTIGTEFFSIKRLENLSS